MKKPLTLIAIAFLILLTVSPVFAYISYHGTENNTGGWWGVYDGISGSPSMYGYCTGDGQAFVADASGDIAKIIVYGKRFGAEPWNGILTCSLFGATGTLGTSGVPNATLFGTSGFR